MSEIFVLLRLARMENESLLSFSPSEDATQVEYPAACRGVGRTKRAPSAGIAPRYEYPLLTSIPTGTCLSRVRVVYT